MNEDGKGAEWDDGGWMDYQVMVRGVLMGIVEGILWIGRDFRFRYHFVSFHFLWFSVFRFLICCFYLNGFDFLKNDFYLEWG